MDGAFASIDVILRDRLDDESLSVLAGLRADGCIVVSGEHDHIDRFLKTLCIPFVEIGSHEVSEFPFCPSQTVYVNCQGSFPQAAAARLRRFVQEGGQLVTTDWALKSVLEVAFPGFVRHNGRVTGAEAVPVHVRTKNDPIVQGFLGQAPGTAPHWSLEASSYPITVLSDKVRKLLVSPNLKNCYGEDAVMVHFDFGAGAVYHLISHLYLQHASCAHSAASTLVQDYGLKHCRTATAAAHFQRIAKTNNVNYAQVQAACSMAEVQVLLLCKHALDSRARRNLPAQVVTTFRRLSAANPASRASSLQQLQTNVHRPNVTTAERRPMSARVPHPRDEAPRARSQVELLHRAAATRMGHMRQVARVVLFGAGADGPEQFLQKCVHIRANSAVRDVQQGEDVLVDLVSQLFFQSDCDDDLLEFHLEENIKPLLVPRYTRIYSLQPRNYGKRGGLPYFKPMGWRRFAINVDNFDTYKSWQIAYHGTKSKNACAILMEGLRRPEKDQCAHGAAGAKKLLGIETAIYVSPALGVSAHPVYSPLHQVKPGLWAQMVLQCRIRPGSYAVQDNTLANHHWPKDVPLDMNFPNNRGVEWLVRDGHDVKVYGVLIRQFGEDADMTVYGELCTQVHQGDKGPEYVWTELLTNSHRQLMQQ